MTRRGRKVFSIEAEKSLSLLLASDLHIGHHNFDHELFTRQFDRAKEIGARILINGDLWDVILHGDRKRHTMGADPYQVDPQINMAVKHAADLLRPYVDYIDLLGVGNHETAVIKYRGVDPTQWLLGILNMERTPSLAPIYHGGWRGFCCCKFHRGSARFTYRIYRAHGSGGAAPVSKGMINLDRLSYVNADLVWIGHKHTRIWGEMPPCVDVDTKGYESERLKSGLITGSYIKNFELHDPNEEGGGGYQISYSETIDRPQAMGGGAFLHMDLSKSDIEARIEIGA